MKKLIKKEIVAVMALSTIGMIVASPPSIAVARESSFTIEEVVVTARKRQESLQEVPVAITAIAGSDMSSLGVTDVSDLQAHVPNLTTYPARGTTSTLTAYIRGIGQSDPLWGVDPGVGLYFDGVYIARPQGALLDIFDVERVEVLRGPQGTLYGKNTIGGAINYVSSPLVYETTGDIYIAYGNYDQKTAKGMINVPLIDNKLVMKVAGASITRREGFSENINTGSEHISDKEVYSGRVALQWDPIETLRVKFSADYTEDRAGALGPTLLNPNPQDVFNNPDSPVLEDIRQVRSGLQNKNDTETQGYSLTMDMDLSEELQLKSITAYRKGATDTYIDFDSLPDPLVDVQAIYEDDQFSQELQLNYNGDGWNLVTGIYFMTGEAGGVVENQFLFDLGVFTGMPALEGVPFPAFAGALGGVETTSYSFYSQGDVELTDTLTLTLGGRITVEEKEATVFNANYADSLFIDVTTIDADFSDSKTFREFSPKIGLDWQVSEDILLYTSYSEGFKSGGFNVRAKDIDNNNSDEPYDPETVNSFELGAKTTLAEGRVTLNGALFHNTYEDMQLSIFSTASDGTFFGDFTNAGEATMKGAELEVVAVLNESLILNGSIGYLDTDYDEFITSGIDISDTEELTNAPELTYNIGLAYDFPAGNWGDILARVDYAWRDDSVLTTEVQGGVTDPNKLPLVADSYGVVNASVRWDIDQNWHVILLGKNLTDEEYLVTGYNITSVGVRTGFYGEPRTWAIAGEYQF